MQAEHVHSATPPLPPLPTIADLGRRLAALDVAYSQYEDVQIRAGRGSPAHKVAEGAMNLICEQREALRNLIGLSPALTLADAVAQLAVASDLACSLWCDQYDEPVHEPMAEKLNRILLSVLPVIATAAGVDLDAMGWDQYSHLRTYHFHGLENAA